MIAHTQCNANTSLRGRKAKRYKTKKGRENMADSYLLLCGDRIQQFSIMKIAESRVCLFRRECTPFFPLLQFVTLLFSFFRLYTTITTPFRWRAAICKLKTEKRYVCADFLSANTQRRYFYHSSVLYFLLLLKFVITMHFTRTHSY